MRRLTTDGCLLRKQEGVIVRIAFLYFLSVSILAGQPGLKGFHRIDHDVYRGSQPSAEGFTTLAGMGIKTVIDLRGGCIHMPWEKKLVEKAGMRYVEERFSGIFEPHDAQIAKIIGVMEDPANAPVFVHCKRGADRVGMVIACYRITHDHWNNEQALREACDAHISPFEILMRRYIRHFDPSRLTASGLRLN